MAHGLNAPLRLLLLCLVVSFSDAKADQFVYVSIAGENRIAVYSLDHGRLMPQGDVKLSGGPGALCVHPNGKYLFAAVRSVGKLAGFSINDDGSLTPINEVATGADPAYLATDRSERYLLSESCPPRKHRSPSLVVSSHRRLCL